MPPRRHFLFCHLLPLGLLLGGSLSLGGMFSDFALAETDYSTDIQPIFVQKCLLCHGPDEQEAGLRLDLPKRALAETDSGKRAIVPGDVASSELIRRVTTDDEDERMPPVGEGETLTPGEVESLRTWIAAGAVWDVHWSYRELKRPEPPALRDSRWAGENGPAKELPAGAIDRFVLARLNRAGIGPSPAADSYTLIKRLYYDLLGLPPGPEAVDTFVNDTSDDAYERLVDELLRSPRFGERWGRHWLDKARYADSDGYEKDKPRMKAWHYRDWVIDAINRDVPYDRFSILQLAGDLVEGATPFDRLATAFHRQTLTNTEGGTDQEEFRVKAVVDRLNTTGTVWLGLTIGCAQCHSHKYDQINQREYYEMFAFFNNGDETESELPLGKTASPEDVESIQLEVAAERDRLVRLRGELASKLPAWEKQLTDRLADTAPLEFHPIEVREIVSKHDTPFRLLDDGSYLAEGPVIETDKYTIRGIATAPNITGVRVEALADPSLGGGGPGRTRHGNFVLSGVRVYAGYKWPITTDMRVPLAGAEADYSQPGYDVTAAIDGDRSTGWGVHKEYNRNHAATFTFESPIHRRAEPDRPFYVQVVLEQSHGGNHTIGRFRVSLRIGGGAFPEKVKQTLATPPERRTDEQQEVLLDYRVSVDEAASRAQQKLADLEKRLEKAWGWDKRTKVRVISQRSSPRTTHILHRGDFLQPGDEVVPAALETLPGLQARRANGSADRLDFARWLFDPANPLVPRVAVNHVWARLFGEGLVRTINDFGVRGERPTHPDLLDWLAVEYRRLGWSRKALIKTIVMSSTYRQASHRRADADEADPLNRLLHRQNRFRVEAEIVRDLYLAAGGLLSERVGGPSVFPPLPPGIAGLSYSSNFSWKTSTGENRYRRGMYTFFKRTAPHPNLMMFDCPDANTTNVKRNSSNTPLGALATLNNEVFVEAAQGLARRVLEAGFDDNGSRMKHALRLCIVRPATRDELQKLLALLETSKRWYAAHPDDAARLVGETGPENASTEEAAAWVAMLRIVLNLDEFITRE